ncbi:poxvirus D5 protein [Rhizophagus irregularis DAOM 181602=DAOM 197198]|nr:poxvirus D5 protein [Rhizophagus irregularis DAOM 181602=DAOM 197198]
MAAQVPAIFNPNNRFFYDDLLKKCVGTHTKESVNSAISASVAFITTKFSMWIRKKKAYNGSIYFEFTADLKGISTKHKVIIRSDTGEDSDATTSTKLKDLLLQASIAKICYTDVNFMPYPPNAPKYNPEFFNLFLGFRAQPAERIKPNLVNPIIRHVHEVWCAEDKQLTIYILNWLAFLIQNPDKKPERILGRENFLSTTRLEDVMGRFNAAVRAKKLIILNECDMSGKEWHGANNRLKSLITESYISIEEKGIDVKVIDDFAGYMILSNHAMPIRIEMGDERFVALNVSAKYKGNREYFGSLVKVLENPDTASSFMSYLLSRDLTSFNPRSIPDTQMKRELIEATLIRIGAVRRAKTKHLVIISLAWRLNNSFLKPAQDNFSKVIQDVQDVQKAPVEEVELVAEKPAEKKPEPVEEKPAPVIRKTPPPLPPKPDHLKKRPQESREEKPSTPEPDNYDVLDDLLSDSDSTTANPVPEKPSAPEPDNYDILDDLLSDSDSTTMDPTPEQQSESPAESSASVTKPDPEPAPEEQLIPEPDTEPEVDRNPEPKEGTRAHWACKELWAKYQDASDDYDWEILAFEVEECPTTRIEDEYQYYLREVVDRFKDWIEYNGYLPKTPSHKGKAREIPEERPKTNMEREWEAANGIIDEFDDEYFDEVCDMIDSI